MAKKSRTRTRAERTPAPLAPGEVGPRQPCPCGSGKRYKACHGAPGGASPFVARPFEGLTSEADIVALRELVPSATAPLTLAEGAEGVSDAGREVVLCSLLPMAAPAMVRESGAIWLGLQVQHSFGDPSRDLGAVLVKALATTEPGIVGLTSDPGPGPRLQDLVVDEPLTVTVHEGFDWWVADVEDDGSGTLAGALEQANSAVNPTAKLASVPSAYWTEMGPKEHLRWLLPHPEDAALDALARARAAGEDTLVEGGRLVGFFRAQGLVTPVWDLPPGTGPEALEDPVSELAERLAAHLENDEPLTQEERNARSSIGNRQITLR